MSEQTKKRISVALKGRKLWKVRLNVLKGRKHPNWKGGVTPQRQKEVSTEQYRLFVNGVLKRDAYTCQECKVKSGCGVKVRLEVHHKKSYAEYPALRFDVDNGITLCKNCHLNTLRNHKMPKRVDKLLKERNCFLCKKPFSKRNPRKYCDNCKKISCVVCDKTFTWKNGKKNQRFCSEPCFFLWYSENKKGKNNSHWKEKIPQVCDCCQREYLIKPSLVQTTKFCSRICRNKWQSEFMKENNPKVKAVARITD